MSRFENSKIVKIYNTKTSDFYIGATTRYNLEKYLVKASSKRRGNKNLFENKKYLKIKVIENFSCDTEKEMEIRKFYYIKKLNPSYNIRKKRCEDEINENLYSELGENDDKYALIYAKSQN